MDTDELVAFAVSILLILLVVIGTYFGKYYQCSSKADAMEVPYQFGLFTGCLIKPDRNSKWVPIDNYRAL